MQNRISLLIARLVVWLFECYAAPTVSGRLVNAYGWAIDLVYPPQTEEDRAEWERFRRQSDLEFAAERLEKEPLDQWMIPVPHPYREDETYYRGVSNHRIAADLRLAIARADSGPRT